MFWHYLLSAVPLALFILLLLVLDSFSLTKWSTLLCSIGAGVVMCLLSRLICRIPFIGESKLAVSAVEELCKGAVLYLLIVRHVVGLLGDATIYGSAIGAGFGLASNILYLATHDGALVMHTLFLGLEAAVMHIGTTSTLAMALIMVRQGKFGDTALRKHIGVAAAFLAAILIHYLHALELINPVILTLLLVAYFIYSKRSLFRKNERFVHDWLDEGINNEITLMSALQRGEFSSTPAGEYLLSLRERFEPETFFDMYCYVQNYLELSISARSNLILKEAGMAPQSNPDNRARLQEMAALRKRIGPTGLISLRPIVHPSDVNNWAMENLI